MRESEKEVKKTQLMALLVANSIEFSSSQGADEWSSKIKNLFSRYMALEYGIEMAPEKEKEIKMLEFYQGFVKKLKPVLHNENGNATVKGLEQLLGLAAFKQQIQG